MRSLTNANRINEIPAALCIDGDQWKRADPSLVFPKVTGFLALVKEGTMDEIATATRPRAAQGSGTGPLFQPYRLGPFNLRHRIVMAPLTRSRARNAPPPL
jgi:hypothetical protein